MGLFDRFRKRRPGQSPRLAMVLLSEPRLPMEEAVVAAWAERWKGSSPRREVKGQGSPGIFTVSCREGDAHFALMPAPIPGSEFQALVPAMMWPGAPEELPRSRAHLIVTVTPAEDDRIEGGLFLTRAVASVIAAAGENALGVYWGEAPQLLVAPLVTELAEEASRDFVPVLLWLALRGIDHQDGSRTLISSGMSAYGFMELELVNCRAPSAEMTDFLINCAHYLFDRGPVLGDGETIGMSETQKIRIRHLPSAVDPDRQVYRLEL